MSASPPPPVSSVHPLAHPVPFFHSASSPDPSTKLSSSLQAPSQYLSAILYRVIIKFHATDTDGPMNESIVPYEEIRNRGSNFRTEETLGRIIFLQWYKNKILQLKNLCKKIKIVHFLIKQRKESTLFNNLTIKNYFHFQAFSLQASTEIKFILSIMF